MQSLPKAIPMQRHVPHFRGRIRDAYWHWTATAPKWGGELRLVLDNLMIQVLFLEIYRTVGFIIRSSSTHHPPRRRGRHPLRKQCP